MTGWKGEYLVYEWSPLIYKESFPTWITKESKRDFSTRPYPAISDIQLPYYIHKRGNDEFFYLIKNNDSLKFKLQKN